MSCPLSSVATEIVKPGCAVFQCEEYFSAVCCVDICVSFSAIGHMLESLNFTSFVMVAISFRCEFFRSCMLFSAISSKQRIASSSTEQWKQNLQVWLLPHDDLM